MHDEFDARLPRLLDPGTVGGPLTDDVVAEVERALGVRLPAELLALLRHQNGGYVRSEFSACPTSRPTSWADDHIALNEIAGIGTSHVLALDQSRDLNKEWVQPPELVLLSGDGHWWIALDYRTCGPTGEPPVIFYENDSEGSPDDLRLAASFREFVCLLGPEPEIEVTLQPGQVKSVWIDPDFAREHGIEVPPENAPE